MATVLKSQGYATGQFGKNHQGDRDEHLPTQHGFEHVGEHRHRGHEAARRRAQHVLQRDLGDLALVRRVQIEELAPRVRQAADLGHTTCDQGLVAAEVVTGQAAPPATQEGPRMITGARLAEVVDHGLHIFECPRGVGPEVGPVRLAVAGLEHLHRRLIGMQHAVLEHLSLECIHQRLQPNPACAHPLCQG